ncbi:hypothetical protein C4J81_03005 [Deltaproteobacteria bacterium Smac51]|nr:hypothetical protein C4J81_03005 [Deltaproteobacteria bacterium Smac51]
MLTAPIKKNKASGFTLLELMVVVAIAAILMTIAVIAYAQYIPYITVRADAKNVLAMMQRARLTAANTQRPVRFLIDCTAVKRQENDNSCGLRLQSAVYETRVVDGKSILSIGRWQNIISGGDTMRKNVRVKYSQTAANSGKMNLYDMFSRMFDFSGDDGTVQYGVRNGGDSNDDEAASDRQVSSFVAIFLPNGQVITNTAPYSITFYYTTPSGRGPGLDKLAWRLDVNNSTGLVKLTRTAEKSN